MSVAQELDRFRADLPGCSLVVFGDLFSQITLCVSAHQKQPQEQLDSVCVTAGSLLDGPISAKVASVLGMAENKTLSRAIVLSPHESQIFIRSEAEDADVLCCLGSLDVDVDQAVELARRTFNQMSELQ